MPLHVSSTMCSSSGGQKLYYIASLNLCTRRPPTGVMIPEATGADPCTSRQSEKAWHLRGDAVENGGKLFRKTHLLRWRHIPHQWQGERTQRPYLGNRATTCTDRAPAWLSESQRFLCGVRRESARPIFLHWSNCVWRLISRHFGKLVVTPTEHQLWQLHSTTGRCSPPIFTGMCGCFSIVFFNSAGSDVPQKETATFSLCHPVRRISNTMRFRSLGVR